MRGGSLGSCCKLGWWRPACGHKGIIIALRSGAVLPASPSAGVMPKDARM